MLFKMAFSSKRGVFSPSEKMDSASMIRCLQALYKDHPLIEFDSIISDEKLQGFRVLFSGPEESTVLERNQLLSEGAPVCIYPLTSFLIIFDVDQKKTALFERDVRDAINKKFGKVLGIVKSNGSFQRNNWRIEIDVPEFKELDVFRGNSTTDMTISLPDRNERLGVKLWCRECQTCGHFQHECFGRYRDDEESTTERHEVSLNGNKKSITLPKCNNGMIRVVSGAEDSSRARSPVRASEGPSEVRPDFSIENTERYAEKIGREEIMTSGILSNETRKRKESKIAENGNLLNNEEIKKEKEDPEPSRDAKELKTPESKKSETVTSLKDELLALIRNASMSNRSRDGNSDDDDVQVIGDSNQNSPTKYPSRDANYTKREKSSADEASRSPAQSASAQYSSFSSFTSNPGPSYESPSVARPARGAEVTTALSERLQDCINMTCDDVGVLDRRTLDAFLIHVKKKSNPIRVALNYTPNAKGLKEQLQKILHIYYNTPQTGTKEDIQFIKWLNGLVERFDGSIPRKRKRGGQGGDEPPSKM